MIEPTRPPPEVDVLARRLRRHEPSAERTQVMRHALVDAASPEPRWLSRRSMRGWTLGAAAAAAVLAIGLVALRRHDERTARAPLVATTSPATSPAAPSSAPRPPSTAPSVPSIDATPDHRPAPVAVGASSQLPDGITTVEARQPIQMTRGNETITAPAGARFTVAVQGDRVRAVTVTTGWVVIASAREAATIVPERQTWTLPVQAASPPTSDTPGSTPSAARSAASPLPQLSPRSAASGSRSPPLLPSSSTGHSREPALHGPEAPEPPVRPDASVPEPPPMALSPPTAPSAERDFHDGLRALLAGRPREATAPLAHACAIPSGSQPDVCYWAAVARQRTGDHAGARTAFAELASRWPGSTHIGETNIALGWLLLESGDRAGARIRFAAAAQDPMPDVRSEALRGLAASQ